MKKAIYIGEMKPCSVGIVVVSPDSNDIGNLVMRTAAINKFEVMDLSALEPGGCWLQRTARIKVRVVDASLTIQVRDTREE